MAWLERKDNGPYHLGFRFAGERYKPSLETTDKEEAEARRQRLEESIRLVKSGRLTLPDDADVSDFLLSDGKLNGKPRPKAKLQTLRQFKEAFLDSIPQGSLEENTLDGMDIHFTHLFRVFGKSRLLRTLTLEILQDYVDTRSKDDGLRGKKLSPATIKKELTTLRTLWNWAKNAEYFHRAFPSRGLRYPKSAEKPPFQTWAEITRKIEAYKISPEKQADLWECLFLTTVEIAELLADVKKVALQPCIYPMLVFAAHTGARRSEILRSQVDDVDLLGRTLTIREKKRVRGRCTTRAVPISPALYNVLEEWLANHPGIGSTFFLDECLPSSRKTRSEVEPLTPDEAQHHLKRSMGNTEKWSPIRGWHVFRHSFCSNCAAAGIDQRIINSWVGHQTEEMVKRYRHLIPNQQQEAIAKVFASPREVQRDSTALPFAGPACG